MIGFLVPVLTEEKRLLSLDYTLHGHSYMTHSFLLKGEGPPVCIPSDESLTVEHILSFCSDSTEVRGWHLPFRRCEYYSKMYICLFKRNKHYWNISFSCILDQIFLTIIYIYFFFNGVFKIDKMLALTCRFFFFFKHVIRFDNMFDLI